MSQKVINCQKMFLCLAGIGAGLGTLFITLCPDNNLACGVGIGMISAAIAFCGSACMLVGLAFKENET